jgi:transposase-like protein
MTKRYSEEFKASIIAKLLPPHNVSVPDMVKETGVPKDTLYTWRNQYRNRQVNAEASGNQPTASLNNQEKLAIVIESASLTEVELGEYCRRKGLYPEQIAGWKNGFALGSSAPLSKAEREQMREQAATIKQLEKELNRKDKALAETAALLILQKKFQALWEEPEAEKSTSRRAKN